MTTTAARVEACRTVLAERIAVALAAPSGPYDYGDIASVAGGSLYDSTVMLASLLWDNEPTPAHRTRTPKQADALGLHLAGCDPTTMVRAWRKDLAVLDRHPEGRFGQCWRCRTGTDLTSGWPCLEVLAVLEVWMPEVTS